MTIIEREKYQEEVKEITPPKITGYKHITNHSGTRIGKDISLTEVHSEMRKFLKTKKSVFVKPFSPIKGIKFAVYLEAR